MSLVCPSCEAAYDIPLERLGGRAVRCVRCGHEWRPGEAVAGAEAATEPAAPMRAPVSISVPAPMLAVKPSVPIPVLPETRSIYPVPPPFERPAPPPSPAASMVRAVPYLSEDESFPATPAGSGVILGWLASLLVVFGLLWAAYAYRDPIMAAWPPSIRVYAALGMV